MGGVSKVNVKVGLNKNTPITEEDIREYFPSKKVRLIREDYGVGYIFNVIPTKDRLLKGNEFYRIISHVILNIILNEYSRSSIEKRIGSAWPEFNFKEKKEIARISEEILKDESNFMVGKENFKSQIENYLKETKLILLDGFIRFRSKEFNLLMDLAIDRGVEEFRIEKEYKDFIDILQYFVESQESKYDLINVVFKNDDYVLLNKKDELIHSNIFNEIILKMDSDNISKDDLLVSSLIVIAPEKIIIHLNKVHEDEGVIKTIANIFKNKVYYCFGCPKCAEEINIKNDNRFSS